MRRCARCAAQSSRPLRPVAPVAPVAPSLDFTRTLRVDYFHSGGPGGEALKLDAVIVEGAWPGNPTQLIDRTDLGKYYFEVVDPVSTRVLYSRGFASIYGEWETTPEFRAKRSHVSRIAAVSLAGRSRACLHQETRPPERVRAAVAGRRQSAFGFRADLV